MPDTYGGLPTFLPSATIVPDSVLTGRPDHPAVATEGDVVRADLGSGAVSISVLVNAMRDLKSQDVWMVGLDIGQNVPPIDKTDLNMSIGLVLGSEGEGLRRLVRDTCDLLLALPMRGSVASLNVATTGAVALYAAWQARSWEGWAHA